MISRTLRASSGSIFVKKNSFCAHDLRYIFIT